MSAITRPWNRLTLAGKIILPAFLVLVLLTVLLLVGWEIGLIPGLLDIGAEIVNDNIDIIRFILAATAILLFTVPTAFVIIFMELKVIAFINGRIGPNRTGPWGTLASVFAGFKVLAKEDYTPTGADAAVFTLAPIVTYLAVVLTPARHPVRAGPRRPRHEHRPALLLRRVGGLSVVGLMMGGWSSFNKYSLLGGLRAAAQIVSLRAAAAPGAGRRDHARRHAVAEHDRRCSRPAGSGTGTCSSSRLRSSSSSSPPPLRATALRST